MSNNNGDMPAMPLTMDADGVAQGLTKREMFCLHMGVADTGDAELDAIIRKGNRQKIAMHMMAATQSKDGKPDFHYEAIMSAQAVDALLEELERTR